jgi:hypothetical protein
MKNKINNCVPEKKNTGNGLKISMILLLIVVVFLGTRNSLVAQDIIILKNGDEIKSLVTEIGTDLIKYRKFENLNGPIYTLEKDRVFMIKYENGTKDVFNTSVETTRETNLKKEPQITSFSSLEPLRSNGMKVFQGGKKLSVSEVRRLLVPFPDASHTFNAARVLNGFDVAVSIIGIGVYCAVYIMTNEFWPAFGALSPFLITDWILYGLARKNLNASVNLYNFKINNQVNYKLDFGIQKYGVGFALKF